MLPGVSGWKTLHFSPGWNSVSVAGQCQTPGVMSADGDGEKLPDNVL